MSDRSPLGLFRRDWEQSLSDIVDQLPERAPPAPVPPDPQAWLRRSPDVSDDDRFFEDLRRAVNEPDEFASPAGADLAALRADIRAKLGASSGAPPRTEPAAPRPIVSPPPFSPAPTAGAPTIPPPALALETLSSAPPVGPAPAAAMVAAAPPAPSGDPRLPVYKLFLSVGGSARTIGLLVLAFVAYQLWGTSFAEARSQSALEQSFESSLAAGGDAPTIGGADTAPAVARGDAVAKIEIPRIGVEKYVVEGTATEDLKKGPGHYAGTPLPGEPGNAAIAGHRTTYGAPFFDLDELETGDEILVTTTTGTHTYLVTERMVVSPSDVGVLDPPATDGSSANGYQLTLTTCHPAYSARKRLVVVAEGVPPDGATAGPVATGDESIEEEDAAPALGDVELTSASVAAPATGTGGAPPSDTSLGLAGDPSAWPAALMWGALLLGLWFGAKYLAARHHQPRAAFLIAPVVALVLLRLFEDINRLLPANL